MKTKRTAVDRNTLTRASMLLCENVIDNESLPDEVRDEAAEVQFILSEFLCYPAMPEQEIRVVPALMKVPNGCRAVVEELELEVGHRDLPLLPLQFMLAYGAADAVDHMLYSFDFRFENYDVLCNIISDIRRRVEDDDDEIDWDDETSEIRSNYVDH